MKKIPDHEQYDRELQLLNFPDNLSDEELQIYHEEAIYMVQQKFNISVIYNPDCGCNIDMLIGLNTVPMHEKIRQQCPACKECYLASISNPIIFHCPWSDEDITLEELKNCYLPPENPQSRWLEACLEFYSDD